MNNDLKNKEKDFKIEQMETEVEEMTALRYLTKENAVFTRTKGGFVSLEYDGKKWDRVQVIRLFPFTEPNQFISIRTVEERSKEIGIIKDMKQVSKDTRKMLEEQLNLHYFTPIILTYNKYLLKRVLCFQFDSSRVTHHRIFLGNNSSKHKLKFNIVPLHLISALDLFQRVFVFHIFMFSITISQNI